jgi:CBS domain-containing protein
MNVQRILDTKGSGVIMIRLGQSIREAITLLVKHNIGALVVVDKASQPVGCVSERGIVRALARDVNVFEHSISKIMRKNVPIAQPKDSLMAVANIMTEERVRHLPVMDEGKLVGIVSIGDVVKFQRDQYQGEVQQLQTYVFDNWR